MVPQAKQAARTPHSRKRQHPDDAPSTAGRIPRPHRAAPGSPPGEKDAASRQRVAIAPNWPYCAPYLLRFQAARSAESPIWPPWTEIRAPDGMSLTEILTANNHAASRIIIRGPELAHIGMSELVRVVTPARRSPSSASDTASVSSAQSPSRTAARRAVIKSHPHRRLSRPRPRQAGNPAVYLCIVSAWPHRPLLPLQVRLMISTWRHSEMAEPYRHSRRSVDPVAG
jgi:hypothetical protein